MAGEAPPQRLPEVAGSLGRGEKWWHPSGRQVARQMNPGIYKRNPQAGRGAVCSITRQ